MRKMDRMALTFDFYIVSHIFLFRVAAMIIKVFPRDVLFA